MAAQGAVQYAIAVVPADERDVQARRRMGALLFERVAPPSAVAFLTRFVEVGDALDDFLAGRAPDGELAALLAEADRLAGGPPQHRAAAVSTDPVMAPLLPEPVRALPHATAAAEPRPIASPRAAASSKRHTRAVGSREPSPVARDFLAWLRAGLTSGEVACNGAGAPVHIVEEGLALVSPAVFRHYASRYEDPAEVASRTGQASLDRMGLSIQREVLRSGMHEPNPADGSNFWAFELLGGDGAVAGMLSVVLLPAASPWTSAKAAVNPALRRKAAASTAP